MESLINRIFALFWMIILTPIFLFAIFGIILSDFGPVLYKAERAGKDGQIFKIFKFRSMRVSRKNESKITGKNDSRIFSFGKFMRLTKIDELPQLINILRGEMNFVGPRPEDITIVQNHYDKIMLESLNINPGLASPGSLYNYTHIEDVLNVQNPEQFYVDKILPLKVRIDVIYARNRNFNYDLKIIFDTIKIIFLKSLGKKDFPMPKEYSLAKII